MFLSSEYMLKSLEAHAPKSSFSVFILMKKKKKFTYYTRRIQLCLVCLLCSCSWLENNLSNSNSLSVQRVACKILLPRHCYGRILALI